MVDDLVGANDEVLVVENRFPIQRVGIPHKALGTGFDAYREPSFGQWLGTSDRQYLQGRVVRYLG